MTDVDAKLKSLLALAPRATDEAFVKRVDCAVMAEEKMIAAHAAMWCRFGIEVVSTLAVIAAFYLLWKIAPSDVEIETLMHAPGMAASMILLLWLGVQLKQSLTLRGPR